MLKELKRIGDQLDKSGFKKEADKIDRVIISLADAGVGAAKVPGSKKNYWFVQDKITSNFTDLIQNFHRAAQSLSSGQVPPDMEDEIRGELYRKVKEVAAWLPEALKYSQFQIPPNTLEELKVLFGPKLTGVARKLENRFTDIAGLIPELEAIRQKVDELNYLKEQALVQRVKPSPEKWLETVELIFKWRGEGMGPKAIVEKLEAEKRYPPRGGKWMVPQLYSIWKNPKFKKYQDLYGHHLKQ